MSGREGEEPVAKDDRDLLDVLMSIKGDDGEATFGADIVTGMFISMMFAGHHTTSGTAAWTLIELLRHPDVLAAVVAELEALADEQQEISRSEEHTSDLQSLMRISYAVFCLKK